MKSELSRKTRFNRSEGELTFSSPMLSDFIRAVFEKGLPFRFRVKGFSMSPFIKDGDVVTIAPLVAARPYLGDVVAVTRPKTGELVVHRVVGKKSDACLISGDNMSGVDGLIPKANILGFVKAVERDGMEVTLGLGPERWLIALLVRTKLLLPLMLPVWRFFRPLVRRNAR